MDGLDGQAFSIHDGREGAPQAFRELFFQYYPEFFSFARSLLGDKAVARNNTTNAFFLLWKKRAHFDSDRDGKAFLYNTIRNSCLNYLTYLQNNPDATENPPEITMHEDFPSNILQELQSYVARVT